MRELGALAVMNGFESCLHKSREPSVFLLRGH
jgi:hypothetical protein